MMASMAFNVRLSGRHAIHRIATRTMATRSLPYLYNKKSKIDCLLSNRNCVLLTQRSQRGFHAPSSSLKCLALSQVRHRHTDYQV